MRYIRLGVWLFWMAGIVQAMPAGQHMIVAPVCLLAAASVSSTPLAAAGDLRLLPAGDATVDALIQARTAQRKAGIPCGGFRDVTRRWESAQVSPNAFLTREAVAMPVTRSARRLGYPDQVNHLLTALNPQNMWRDLTTLTAFKDRYANSDTGVRAADWIRHELETMAAGRSDVTVSVIPTGGYRQPSVIMKVGEGTGPGVVVSAHLDTVSGWSWWSTQHMPGADDDGSGTVTVLETARVVLASGQHFQKPVYFMWFAAEEEGLVGSGNVVEDFVTRKIPVEVALHFDMTGYAAHNDPTLWLLQDYTNPEVTTFLASLIKTYVHQAVRYTQCGYACSDHASWTEASVPAGAATESSFKDMNSHLHTPQDTMEKLSLAHMTDYLKLALAFVVEAAVPVRDTAHG